MFQAVRYIVIALGLLQLQIGCRRPSAEVVSVEFTSEDPVAEFEAAVAAKDWQLARRLSSRALIARPNDPELVTEAARATALGGDKRAAAELLAEAARLTDYQPAARVTIAVQSLVDVGEIYTAIDLLEASLQEHPTDDTQRRIVVGFLNEVQRTDRIPVHLRHLIERRKFDIPLLLSTTETSSRRLSESTSSRLLQRNPADRRLRLPEAFLLLYRRDGQRAAEVLQDILEHHPDFASAHAMYGQALIAAGRWEEMSSWLTSSPADSQNFADYWLTLGDIAHENDQIAESVRSYWEATRRDPNQAVAWGRLRLELQRLVEVVDEPLRETLIRQMAIVATHEIQVIAVRERFNDFAGRGSSSQTAAIKLAESLVDVGRVWEAEAWSAVATTLTEEPTADLDSVREDIFRRLRRDGSWIDTRTPALSIDLSHLALPHLASLSTRRAKTTPPSPLMNDALLRFSELSDVWGLSGVGAGNSPPDDKREALIRTTGVGGGAIDYDMDGYPDLVVMNAAGTILKSDSLPNDLFRNVEGEFVRVSRLARIDDRGFGQGVAVGDFNEDGFSDLFFANLGRNRLMRNNGDGSFTDCTQNWLMDDGEHWSTSAAFVDFNQDALTDLVVTNYCAVEPQLDQACLDEKGVPSFCHPLKFAAEQDQFFTATPTGKLMDHKQEGTTKTSGRGLGLVAGTLADSQFAIFIANDMSSNAFYTHSSIDRTQLVENALTRGVAVDGRSQAQASMGIAASDFDLDGDLDFYVTGFAREYNIYYEQTSPGMWVDQTNRLGLVEPTLMMVGFGTQAIDIDNDGIDEITVTNGHIGNFPDPEAPPYELPLQIFRRGAAGTYALVNDDSWGDYFRMPHVGRAMWTTDVNRDGRNDLVVTHANEQIGLLVNEAIDKNHRIGFKVVATDCSRDGVGAVIHFTNQGQKRSIWVLAGDGYFCSNEKTLIAGLGQSEAVQDVHVTWQDGSVDQLGTLAADSLYLVVQGDSSAFSLHHYPND